MTPEGLATKEVRLAASLLGSRLMRNNSGGFYDQENRFVRFGLGNESKLLNDKIKWGDLIGATIIRITPEMVGKNIPVYTNLEVKPDGDVPKTIRKALNNSKSREAGQLRAIDLTKSWGGMAGFVSNKNDVMHVFSEFIQGLSK